MAKWKKTEQTQQNCKKAGLKETQKGKLNSVTELLKGRLFKQW